MIEERTPVCSTISSLGGRNTANGITLTGIDFTETLTKSKEAFGNKCGHDINNPRYYLRPKHYKRRFHVIQQALEIIPKALSNVFDYPILHGLLVHKKNKRSVRSERVEAEFRLLIPALIDCVNLYNMQLGFYTNEGKFINFDYDHLVNLTKMLYCRVERAMRHLQEYGLVTVKKVVRIINGVRYQTEKVIIQVSDDLFKMFSLEDKLLSDKQKSIKATEKILNRIVKPFVKPQFPFKKPPVKSSTPSLAKELTSTVKINRPVKSQSYNPVQDKSVLNQASKIMEDNPGISVGDAIKIATQRNRAPP